MVKRNLSANILPIDKKKYSEKLFHPRGFYSRKRYSLKDTQIDKSGKNCELKQWENLSLLS